MRSNKPPFCQGHAIDPRRLDGLRTVDCSRGLKGSILAIAFELDDQEPIAINKPG